MARRRPWILRLLLNPLVVIAAVVALVAAGWMMYTGATNGIAQARPGANLLPTLARTAGGAAGSVSGTAAALPTAGWTVNHSGEAKTSLDVTDGQVIGQALKLDITSYASGDVTLTSPRVNVDPGKTYLFKAFASSEADFTLLARHHHADGTATLEQLRNPLQKPGNSPFTVSDAFDTKDKTTAVEYVFRLASKGTLRVEGAYLEAADDVRVPAASPAGPNLIPPPGPAGPQPGDADGWAPFTYGALAMQSGRGVDQDGSYFWTRITNYQNGEGKWQYPPVTVAPDRSYEFGASYRADREVDVVAEFELAGGGRIFRNLATLPPAGEWTTLRDVVQAPAGAASVMVTLISHANGTTAVRGYSLTDITRPGPLRWNQPTVSLTFDDGWQSVYDRALPLLNKHNFVSTHYINASSIETPNFMTADELQQLHRSGHEIAAHSYQHVDLTSIGTAQLDEQLRKSEDGLAAAGLATDDLAPPYGRMDPQVQWYAGKYFNVIRGTDDGINTRQNLDPEDLKVLYVTDETTPETLKEALAETKQANGWLIVVYHQISAPDSSGTQEHTIAADRSTITSDALTTQLQIIADSGIPVQTVAKAFMQLQGP